MSEASIKIGAVIFPQIDQLDFTGVFEVLSRLPGSVFFVLGKDKKPVRDVKGLLLTPETEFSEAPKLDILVVPGGPGVDLLLADAVTVEFVRRQAADARLVLSVCTGALLCGAAGLLRGKHATTHWASHGMLRLFGAIPEDERVVLDGKLITTAGVTAGIDGALRAAAILSGEEVAREIQLQLQYSPDPPFNSGDPKSAFQETLRRVNDIYRPMIESRLRKVQALTSKVIN